jgi:hypothetical protein
MLLVWLHLVGLECSFLVEALFPTLERTSPVKYAVISLLPNYPGPYHEYFHKEGCIVLVFALSIMLKKSRSSLQSILR